MGIKCTVLDTKSTIIITVSNSVDSESSITKSILIVSYYIFEMGRRYSLPMDKC